MGGDLEVYLDREAWFPGQTVTGHLVVQLSRPTEVRGFDAWLRGLESAWVKVKSGKHTHTYRASATLVELPLVAQGSGGPLFWPGVYEAGTYTLPFAATLPLGLPPSYSHSYVNMSGGIYYGVYGSMKISWGTDPSFDVAFAVAVPPSAPSTVGGVSSKPVGFGTGGTSIAVELDAGDAPRGGSVRGFVQVDTTGKKRMRSVKVKITEQLRVSVRGHNRTAAATTVGEREFGEGEAAFGAPLYFELPVGPSASPSFEGSIIKVSHAVRAEADLAFALNPKVTAPFHIT